MLAEYFCVKVQCMLHWSPVGKNCGGGGGVKGHGEWYGQCNIKHQTKILNTVNINQK